MRSDPLLMLLLALLAGVGVQSKPVEISAVEGASNAIDHGTISDYKNGPEEAVEEDDTNPPPLPPINVLTSSVKRSEPERPVTKDIPKRADTSVKNSGDESSTNRQQETTWFLAPLFQRLQFSPQTFFQDRFGQLKGTLNNLGFGDQRDGNSKQLPVPGGLLNLVGLNDNSGFYTNKLEPAGFFGGNGWFANKGGIVGGPGALLSTGSILTDYPTPYRK